MEQSIANLGAPSSLTKKLLDTRNALLAENGINPIRYSLANGISSSEQPSSLSDWYGNIKIKAEHINRNSVEIISATDM